MKIDDLLNYTSEWLRGTGPHADIVISSRIRLARNLDKVPFPHWANKKQREQSLGIIRDALKKTGYINSKAVLLELSGLDNVDKQFLIERHLMSYEHAKGQDSKAVVIDEEGVLAIMINEEDHLRIQVMQSGFNLFEAWKIISAIDDALGGELSFAFSKEWGYLTACPTNTGTGMRGSVMLHLPALVLSRQISRVLAAIAKLHFTSRGLYGEGTEASGNFFQISNQVALGNNEEEMIANINGLIKQIIEQEEAGRAALLTQNRDMLEDRICRGFGTLRSAHIISSQETIELLSLLRLGCDLQIIKNIDRRIINELFILTQPAHLQKIEGRKLSTEERDLKRAELIRRKLG
jgi:protein arginine kinase